MKKKVTYSLSEETVDFVEKLKEEKKISRSAVVEMIILQYKNKENAVDYNKIKDFVLQILKEQNISAQLQADKMAKKEPKKDDIVDKNIKNSIKNIFKDISK